MQLWNIHGTCYHIYFSLRLKLHSSHIIKKSSD